MKSLFHKQRNGQEKNLPGFIKLILQHDKDYYVKLTFFFSLHARQKQRILTSSQQALSKPTFAKIQRRNSSETLHQCCWHNRSVNYFSATSVSSEGHWDIHLLKAADTLWTKMAASCPEMVALPHRCWVSWTPHVSVRFIVKGRCSPSGEVSAC